MKNATKKEIRNILIAFIYKFIHTSTQAMDSKFELEIFNTLTKSETFFKNYNKITTKTSSEYDKAIDNYKPDTLIIAYHPKGANTYPDIIIKYNDIIIDIEAKSGKDGTIHWNSTMVQPNTIYIYNYVYSSNKNSILIFLGKSYRELRNRDFKESLEPHIKVVENLTNSFKTELKNNKSQKYLKERKINFYIRENWKSNANLLTNSKETYLGKVKQFINSKLK